MSEFYLCIAIKQGKREICEKYSWNYLRNYLTKTGWNTATKIFQAAKASFIMKFISVMDK